MTVEITQPSYPVLNSVPLATPAWLCNELAPLFSDLPLVGDTLTIPGDDGAITYPMDIGAGVRSFPIWVFADFDSEGDAYSSPGVGLRTNLTYLRSNLGYHETSGDGSVPFDIHWDDGTEWTTDVVNLGMTGFVSVGANLLGRLDLLFASGEFVEAGS